MTGIKNIPRGYFYSAALLIHIVAAWFSIGHYQRDEYNLLELVAYKFGDVSRDKLGGEFDAEFRSALLPFVAWLTAKCLVVVNVYTPFLLAFILRLLSAFLSLAAVIVFYQSHHDRLSVTARHYLLLTLLFLWALVFYHVRFSAEGWATSFMVLGLGLYGLAQNRHKRGLLYLFVGSVFGLAFLARYQVGFMLLGLGAWMLIYDRKYVAYIVGGGCGVLFLGFLLDWWLYESPALSWLNYFRYHTTIEYIEPRSNWAYLQRGAVLLPPISLLIIPAIIGFCLVFRRHFMTWLIVPFIVFHLAAGNVQTRFFYPLLPLIPLMMVMLWDRFTPYIAARRGLRRISVWLVKISLVVNILLLPYAVFIPAAPEVALLQSCILPAAHRQPFLLITRQNNDMSLPLYIDDLPVLEIESEADLPAIIREHPDKNIFYATRKNRAKAFAQSELTYRLYCQALPEWVLNFNVNDWTSRASVWRVWRIHP